MFAPKSSLPLGETRDVALEILAELSALRQMIQPVIDCRRQETQERSEGQFAEARALRDELEGIRRAINETKHEIASLHVQSKVGDPVRATDELDAVVIGTEQATQQILAAAESIEESAGALANQGTEVQRRHAADIQERVITLFEACNFQDLTGQRITKVVGVLRFIEERVDSMMAIWGGAEEFAAIEARKPEREGDAALLNGPALADAEDVASQDDIDALFA